MKNYNNMEYYLNKLKAARPAFDDEKMLARIKGKIEEGPYKAGLALSGLISVFLVGLIMSLYLLSYNLSGSDILSAYVFQPEGSNGDTILNYVLTD